MSNSPNNLPNPSSNAANWSYETAVRQIEVIINQIENGDMELAEVFRQFASAVDYLNQCENFLSQQQQQVDLLIETLTDDGEGF